MHSFGRALKKLASAVRLAARFDGPGIRRQWSFNRTLGLGHLRVRLHGRQPFVFRNLGFPLVCHPDWPDSLAHFCAERSTTPDQWELKLLRHWLEPGDAAIDAGANLGFYTFAAASVVGPSGLVVAIDAAPYVVAKLAASARLLDLPQVVPKLAALGADTGSVTFYVRREQTVTGEQSLRPSAGEMALSVPVAVPACTLTDLAAAMPAVNRPSLVKIDIEGAEHSALAAAPADWFKPDGPLWIIEVNPPILARFNVTPEMLVARYAPEFFDRWLLPKSPAALLPLPLEARRGNQRFSDADYYNFIAVPKGARWRARTDRIAGLFSRDRPSAR